MREEFGSEFENHFSKQILLNRNIDECLCESSVVKVTISGVRERVRESARREFEQSRAGSGLSRKSDATALFRLSKSIEGKLRRLIKGRTVRERSQVYSIKSD
jgi:hypothetical protein